MAESAFNFGSAPGGKGRQFGAVSALAKTLSGKKSDKGHNLSAREQSQLSAQSHAQNKDLVTHTAQQGRVTDTLGAVVNHVLGSEASKQTHKQEQATERLRSKNAIKEETSASENAKSRTTHTVDSIHNLSTNVNVKSANLTTGAFTTTHPQQQGQQFDGQSEG